MILEKKLKCEIFDILIEVPYYLEDLNENSNLKSNFNNIQGSHKK